MNKRSQARADGEYLQRIADLEARTRGILDAVVDGVVIINSDGRIEMFNPGSERIFGLSADEAIGRNISLLMPEPDRSHHDGFIKRYLEDDTPRIIGIGREVTGQRANGDTFPMELAVGEVEGSAGRSFVGVIRDISKRQAIETALQRSEESFRLIFENAPIGVLITDLSGKIIRCNNALTAMLKMVENDVIGNSIADFARSDPDFSNMLGDIACGSRDIGQAELKWQGGGSGVLDVTVHMSVVRLPHAQSFIVGQVVDRTEQMIAEEATNAARAQLAHVGRVATLGEMASTIAHEINQPLTAIATHAQACRRILQHGDSDPVLLEDAFKNIANEALRAGEVVKRIRGFVSKRESRRILVTLGTVLDTVLDLAEVDARAADVRITFDRSAAEHLVFVDPVQIQQVCLNLIRNAIDEMQRYGDGERVVAISLEAQDKMVLTHFDDHGNGVPEAVLGQLFQPFFTTKESGMGMGLSISRSIAVAHDGDLTYSVNEFNGARFTFSLPIASARSERRQ